MTSVQSDAQVRRRNLVPYSKLDVPAKYPVERSHGVDLGCAEAAETRHGVAITTLVVWLIGGCLREAS